MAENNQMIHKQMSRRDFLKGALVAAGLALVSPMALLNSCKDTRESAEKTGIVPGKAPSNESAPATNPPAATTDSPTASPPAENPASFNYSITVDGLVNTPLTLNYDSVLQFPSVTKTVTLTCPGVFEETSEWTGIPLITLLATAGVKPEASQVLVMDSSGYGVPFSVQEQGITSGDIFLAFKYNGQGLPADRGYPLRLVVPGAEGVSWVKGVIHIRLTQ